MEFLALHNLWCCNIPMSVNSNCKWETICAYIIVVRGWREHDKTMPLMTKKCRGENIRPLWVYRLKSIAQIMWLTGTSFMYHLVGDCKAQRKSTTKTYLLEGLVVMLLVIKGDTWHCKEENLCYWECNKGNPHTQKNHRNGEVLNSFRPAATSA